MVKKKEEDYYRNLPRKELQELCKKHGLSANKTDFHLANLLVSFFKGKNKHKPPLTPKKLRSRDVKPTSSKGRSNGHMEVSSHKSHRPKLKSGAPSNCLKDHNESVTGVRKKRTESFTATSSGASSCSKENEGNDQRQIQPVNLEEISMQIESPPPAKISDAAENLCSTDPANNKTIEGFDHSTHHPIIVESQLLSTGHCQDISGRLQSNSKCNDKGVDTLDHTQNNFPESSIVHNSDQNLSVLAKTDGEGIISQPECRNKNIGACPIATGFISSSEISTEVSSGSLQFFVRSDDGINLCVDLNSTHSDWIKSLEKQVCIYQQVYHNKSRIVQQEVRGLGDTDEHIETTLYEHTQPYFHTSDVQKTISSGLNNSSTNSVAEMPGHLEDYQTSSSVSVPDSDVGKKIKLSVISGLRDGKAMHPDVAYSSLKLDAGTASEPNISRNKCNWERDLKTGRVPNTSSQNGTRCSESLDYGSIATANNYPESVDLIRISDLFSKVSEKTGVPSPSQVRDESNPPDIASLNKHNKLCHESSASGSTELRLLKETVGCEEMLDLHPQFGLQLEKVEVEKHQLDQDSCSGVGNFVVEHPNSAISEDQGTNISMDEKESSEYLQSYKIRKRRHSSELEELQNEKQQNNSEYNESTDKNLRSMKNLVRNTSHDAAAVPRRRSTRLVAK